MPVVITGNNTPTAGGITYGDGSTYAVTAAGTSGQPLVSGGAGAPAFRPYTLPATDGSASQLLQTNGSGALSFATISAGFTLGTPVATTSGTSVTFTGIPAGVKQVVISFARVSTNGTANKIIRIGPVAGVESSGYLAVGVSVISGAGSNLRSATDFVINSVVAAEELDGSVILTLENSTTNLWSLTGVLSNYVTANGVFTSAGSKPLAGVLERIQLTTSNGTDAFDLGEVNIAYI